MLDGRCFDASDLQVSSECQHNRSNNAEGEVAEYDRVEPRRVPTNHSRSVSKRPTTPRPPRLVLQKPRDTGSSNEISSGLAQFGQARSFE